MRLFLFLLSFFTLWLFHPRIAVRDIDAVGYIVGAKSLQAGLGYVSATGSLIRPWPRGYSQILSLFPDPLTAAPFINYVAVGIALVLLFNLALKHGWSKNHALCFCLILLVGFFRSIATHASPDALTYPLFLIALTVYLRRYYWGLALFIGLISLKSVALFFLLSAFAYEFLNYRRSNFLRMSVHVLSLAAGYFLFLQFSSNYLTMFKKTSQKDKAETILPLDCGNSFTIRFVRGSATGTVLSSRCPFLSPHSFSVDSPFSPFNSSAPGFHRRLGVMASFFLRSSSYLR